MDPHCLVIFRTRLNFFILASDEFNSNAMAGRISYTVPTPMQLFNAPVDAFNGETLPLGTWGDQALTFELKVHNDDDRHLTKCGSLKNCVL